MKKRVIWIGILAGALMAVAGFVVNLLFHAVFPGLQAIYMDTSIFLGWDDPRMWIFWLYPIALGIALGWLYGMLPKKAKKPLYFSWVYLAVTGIPVFLINYGSFNLPFAMIFSWTVMSYLNGLIAGLLFNKMLR